RQSAQSYTSSLGRACIISFITVSPPTPESIMPIGLFICYSLAFPENMLQCCRQYFTLCFIQVRRNLRNIIDSFIDDLLDNLPAFFLHAHKHEAFILIGTVTPHVIAALEFIDNIRRRRVRKVQSRRKFADGNAVLVAHPLQR